jgi:hypothetical protein
MSGRKLGIRNNSGFHAVLGLRAKGKGLRE